ncbi:LysE family translocator [Bordetella avium]|uniref:LysE family translocator n=1 Tax=Bordetella avium TaxID=521 RepID=UPI000E68EAD0|nr:LysE family translocator [Bordetella avium]RIQ18144.1 LysE family translocator [Bordetella avium]RIQ36614.1 LysE family translocator [Bordetella avium]
MTATTALLAFSIAALIMTLTPGLDTALVLRTAATEGPRRALMAGLGVCLGCLGCLAWGAAAAFGLGALLAASQLAYDILRLTGAAYLFYLGAGLLWRSRRSAGGGGPDIQQGDTRANVSALGWLRRGCLTNLLNPKVGVFYITFLPQFIPQGVNVLGFSLLLAALHALVGLAWFAALVAATRPLARWLSQSAVGRGLDAATGTVFIAFGLRLALERR